MLNAYKTIKQGTRHKGRHIKQLTLKCSNFSQSTALLDQAVGGKSQREFVYE